MNEIGNSLGNCLQWYTIPVMEMGYKLVTEHLWCSAQCINPAMPLEDTTSSERQWLLFTRCLLKLDQFNETMTCNWNFYCILLFIEKFADNSNINIHVLHHNTPHSSKRQIRTTQSKTKQVKYKISYRKRRNFEEGEITKARAIRIQEQVITTSYLLNKSSSYSVF